MPIPVLAPVAILFPFPAAPAPPTPSPRKLDLPEALALARASSPAIQGAGAKVQERQALTRLSRAGLLPELTLESQAARTRDPAQQSAIQSWNAGPGLPVPTLNTISTQATLTQPLYHGGQLTSDVRSAESAEKEARFAARTEEQNALHQAARAYFAALSAQADLDVLRARLEAAEAFRREIGARRSVGTATELDRLRAESEWESVRSEGIRLEAAHRRALDALASQLGLEPGTPLLLADPGEPSLDPQAQAQPRSEISELEARERSLRAQQASLKAATAPRVDLNASWGHLSPAGDSGLRSPDNTWSVALTVRTPLLEGLRSSARVARNRAEIAQNTQARIALERAVALERTSAQGDLDAALASRKAAEAAHDAAREALRTSRAAFEGGRITSLDLLQAQRSERQQERERRQAQLEVWGAWLALRKGLGLPPL